MSHPLSPLFSPSSVAVIGASSTPGKSGYIFSKALLEGGYTGKVYPINPKGGEIDGYPMYKSISEIDGPIDVALFLVNKKIAFESVKECAAHGVKYGVMYSAGFAEQDGVGKQMQLDMVKAANEKGMRIVGPNCMGIYSAPMQLNLTGEFIPEGEIGMISQSGNLGFQLWNDAHTYLDTGFSRFVGVGNQSDIELHEYLDFYKDDPHTKVVIIYMEGIKDGSGLNFIRAAAETAKKKPVVIMKGGKTSVGIKAAASHTASIAGEAALFQAAFQKAGIIEVERFDELLPVAHALHICPPFKGNNLAIGGSGGGQMIISSDNAEKYGFSVPDFSKETYDKLASMLYEFSPKGNPFDQAGIFTENLNVFADSVDLCMSEPGIGGTFIFGMLGHHMPDLVTNGVDWKQAMQNMCDVSKRTGKPVVCWSVGAHDDHECLHLMRKDCIPVYDSAEIAMRSMAALREYGDVQDRDLFIPPVPGVNEATEYLEPAFTRLNKNLMEPEAYKLLEKYGIKCAKWDLLKDASEVSAKFNNFSCKVVEKVVSAQIIHKSEYDAVKTNICTTEEAIQNYKNIVSSCTEKAPGCVIDGILMTEQVEGVEVIAGLVRDNQFGPVLMVGLGGVLVELMRDVNFIILPATKEEIKEKIKSLKGYKLLDGFRGKAKCNVDALVEMIDKLQMLVLENPSIKEMDLNPIFVNSEGCTVADARIIVD